MHTTLYHTARSVIQTLLILLWWDFKPPSLLLFPVQHSEPSSELAQGTAKTQTPRTEITDLYSARRLKADSNRSGLEPRDPLYFHQ